VIHATSASVPMRQVLPSRSSLTMPSASVSEDLAAPHGAEPWDRMLTECWAREDDGGLHRQKVRGFSA
jgi:hypothetical protein